MKPSKIALATAKDTWWVPSNFKYCMLKGIAWTNSERTVEQFNADEENPDRVHETIHVRQAVSKKDSWLRFYIEYVWEWICNIPLIFVKWHAAYKFMPMELEAYGWQNYPSYIDNRESTMWRDIKKQFTLKKRIALAKDWFAHKGTWGWDFSKFCEKEVINKLQK